MTSPKTPVRLQTLTTMESAITPTMMTMGTDGTTLKRPIVIRTHWTTTASHQTQTPMNSATNSTTMMMATDILTPMTISHLTTLNGWTRIMTELGTTKMPMMMVMVFPTRMKSFVAQIPYHTHQYPLIQTQTVSAISWIRMTMEMDSQTILMDFLIIRKNGSTLTLTARGTTQTSMMITTAS